MNGFQCHLQYYEELKLTNAALKNQLYVARSNYEMVFQEANDMEQNNLLNYVDIHGIPELDKNCVPIVEKIASFLDVELSVVQAFKIFTKSKSQPTKIVAELMTLEQKEMLIQFTKAKNLMAKQLNAKWKNERVYINDCLTSYNRKLMFKARTFAKENGFRYVWFRDCKLYLKPTEYSRVYLIRHERDLMSIV